MALVLNDRVKETSTTTGQGTLDLAGAATGFETFVAGVGDGNTTYYAIVHATDGTWEIGIGTVDDQSTDTLARTTVIDTSAGNTTKISFASGTKHVFCTLPASKSVYLDGDGDVTLGANLDIGGNLVVTGTTTFNGGTLTLGDAATDNIAINATITSNLIFEGSSADAHETTLAPGNPGSDITLTLPSSASDTLVGKATTDTLTNKTLTTPVIAEIDSLSSGDITLDAEADIVLDAAGGNIEFKDAGTLQFTIDMDGTAGAQVIKLGVDSDDLVFQQYDGTEVLRIEDNGSLQIGTTGGLNISNSSNDMILKPMTDAKDIIFQQYDGTEVARVEDGGLFDVVANKLAINGTAITSTAAELNLVDGITAGTVSASLAVIVDSNKDISSFRNVTLTGELDAATLDLSGDADIAGTTNLDNTDIDGTLTVDGTAIDFNATSTLAIDNTNTSNGIVIGTSTSGVPISIGHSTSEVTINDNLTVTGNFTVSGTSTTIDSTTVAVADAMFKLAKDQGTSADALDFGIYGQYGVGGTAKYAGIFRDVSATGDPFTFFDTLEAEPGTTVNTSGTGYDLADIAAGGATFADDIDVDGTANLDAVDIDGAVQIDNTITVGANDQGYDVIFYGDAASANMTWDTSADDLILNGAARIVVPDSGLVLGSTAVTSTAAELNLLDGVSGLVQADLTKLAAVDATATELNIMDAGTSASSTTLVDADRIVLNDADVGMKQVAMTDISTYTDSGATALAIALG